MEKGPEKTYTALIVEDDESIAAAMTFNLKKEGFRCLVARNGLEGLRLVRRENPGIMVLDLMLPKMDGWKLCRQVRDEGFDLPIIVCSARTSEFDKVEMLEMGADDYLVKPFSMAELLARVKANLRRTGTYAAQVHMETIKAGLLLIDPERKEAFADGEPLRLTPKELAILHLLVREAPRPLSREDIYRGVWGYEMLHGDRSVDVFIKRLRQKLQDGIPGYTFIQTQYGFGYKFEQKETSGSDGVKG
ncbi:MAG TPA: response regulator transcription factor [Actinobacteria bacterium]|nr:response regulator transcription factor [Actinomycetota bacterium]